MIKDGRVMENKKSQDICKNPRNLDSKFRNGSGSGLLSLESEERECVSQLHDLLRKAMIGANPKVKEVTYNSSCLYRGVNIL